MATTGGSKTSAGFPVWLSSFVGRDTERKVLGQLLDERRLVTLVGPGGCGKTRLASEVAVTRGASGRCEAWFVDLAHLRDPTQVAAAVRTAVGAAEEAWRSPVDAAATAIGNRRVLVVLDNCEQVASGVAVTTGNLVSRCPQLTVLATSRQPLGVEGELIFGLEPLTTPPDDGDMLAVSGYDAVVLFEDRARLARHDFDVTDGDLVTMAKLVRRLDGVPLAIELAAARVAMMSLEQILAGLDDRFALLTRATPAAVDRHQTLIASVEWSHSLLEGREQELLRRLSVFAGSFSLDAVAQVTTGGSVAPDDVVDLVGRLATRSLVQVDRLDGGEVRYRLLDTIRDFAHDRLVAAGEVHELAERHLGWAAALVAMAEPALDGPDQARWLVALTEEHANLSEALTYAAGHRHDTALEMAAGLSLYWKLRSHFGLARETLHGLLDGSEVAPGPAARAARWALADVCSWMGEFDEAVRQAEAVLAEARAAGDDWFAGRALWTLGMVRTHSDLVQARLDGLAAVELAVASGDLWLEGVARQAVGTVDRWSGDYQGARSHLDAAMTLSVLHDVPQLVACSCAMLQWLEVDLGHFDLADRLYASGMSAATEILDPATPGYLADGQAEALHFRGRVAEATEVLERAIAEVRGSGARTHEPLLRYRLSFTLMGGDNEAADAEAALILDLDKPAPSHEVFELIARAWLAVARNETDLACELTGTAIEVARLVGPRTLVEVLCAAGLARVAVEPPVASAMFLEALNVATEVGLRPWVPEALDGLAACLAARGLDVEAARLWGATDRARIELATVRLPVTDAAVAPLEAASRERAGLEHDAARQAGSELTTAQAVVHARRNRGRRHRPQSGWASLTPAEGQVAALAAEGSTNPEIASRLFVSVGTVKSHLSHVFAKLGVSNRTELAAAAARRLDGGTGREGGG